MNYPVVLEDDKNMENEQSLFVSTGNEIFALAPGEGKHPVHFMQDKDCQPLAFPNLFPTGKYGYQEERAVQISPTKYFNARLLNYTGRFAMDPEKILIFCPVYNRTEKSTR